MRWVNGSGHVMPARLAQKNEWFSRKDSVGYDLVTLNHYVLRSAESSFAKFAFYDKPIACTLLIEYSPR